MTCTVATFAGVRAVDARVLAYGDDDDGRILGGAGTMLAAVAAVGVAGVTVAVAAAWIIVAVFATNPDFRAGAPVALETAAWTRPHRRLVDVDRMFAARRAFAPAVAQRRAIEQANRIPLPLPRPSVPTGPAEPAVAKAATADRVPLPAPPPQFARARPVNKENPHHAPAAALPKIADASPPPAPRRLDPVQDRIARLSPHDQPDVLPAPRNRTAVYDIAAHTVYLPGGEKLEAHSGLGFRRDNPRYVSAKGRGPTPPNVYDLTLRRRLFHGVRAIRLNPVDDGRMFGRDGILAHTYMLGPSGQSFGCVSFKHYRVFLHAFMRGEIDRMVVVPHLRAEPFGSARVRRNRSAGTPS